MAETKTRRKDSEEVQPAKVAAPEAGVTDKLVPKANSEPAVPVIEELEQDEPEPELQEPKDFSDHEEPEEEEPKKPEEPEEPEDEADMRGGLLDAFMKELGPKWGNLLEDAEGDLKKDMMAWWGRVEKFLGTDYPAPEKSADHLPEEKPKKKEPRKEPGYPEPKPKMDNDNLSDDFDVEEVQNLLTSSAKKMDEQENSITALKSTVEELKRYKAELEAIRKAEHDSLVTKVVAREQSLGIINVKSIEQQKVIYNKLTSADLRIRLESLKEAKPVEVKRQSLKSAEAATAVSKEDEKMQEIFSKAGLDWGAWKEHKDKR